jgi:hypothetical protein
MRTPTSPSSGLAGLKTLYLTRLTLVGFTLAPPGGGGPPLWPLELLPLGEGVNATDVRLVTFDRATFDRARGFFAGDPTTEYYWTVRQGPGRAS